MTVQNTPPISITRVTDSAQMRYYFDFTLESESDVQVYYNKYAEQKTVLLENWQYTVWRETDNTRGGYVTLLDMTPAYNDNVIIVRKTVMSQVTSYKTTSGFRGDVIEEDFDKATAMIQETALSDSLSPHYDFNCYDLRPYSEFKVTMAYPEANRGLKYDSSGWRIIPTEEDPDEVIKKAEELREETQELLTQANAYNTETREYADRKKAEIDSAVESGKQALQEEAEANRAELGAYLTKEEAESTYAKLVDCVLYEKQN